MLQFSHDLEAGTLYCYLAELEAGQVEYEAEYPASLLLDDEGRIIGLRLALDDDITLDQLELALEHEHCRLDMETGYLYLSSQEAEAPETIALDAPALLDLDGEQRLVGVDVAVPEEYRSAARLAALEPLMVSLDDEATDDGPMVLHVELNDALAEYEYTDDADDADTMAEPRVAATPPKAANIVRSGFVALVGKPNVGKSTLMNALLGQKVAIVSPRPQTTRMPVRGMLTHGDTQIIFIDTPGIHEPNHKLGQLMVDMAKRTLPNADVICFMVDISQPPSQLDEKIAAQIRQARAPKLLVLNKVDLPPRQGESNLDAYRTLAEWDIEIAVSARKRMGLAALLDAIAVRMPLGQALYPDDQVTDQSEQQLAAELLREKVLYNTEHEVPHAVAVEVEEWEQRQGALYIRMTINVERDSQKKIVVGAGGSMLKKIGTAARLEIEKMLDQPVYLDLWVKVRPNWRDDQSSLGWLGYRASRD
jgi:GTP-binding protein Era